MQNLTVLGWASFLFCAISAANFDLHNAPPAFDNQGKHLVPIDFQTMELSLEFDAKDKKATGVATIHFISQTAGYPIFDLVPTATRANLNGQELGDSAVKSVSSPDGVTNFRYLDAEIGTFSTNTLIIEYDLTREVTFSSGGIRMGWFMGDVGADRELLEQYAPASFEFDQFQMIVNMNVLNSTTTHEVFSNGAASETESQHWTVLFPSHFTSSSFYLHITNQQFSVERGVYNGVAANIPVTVYSSSSTQASTGYTKSLAYLAELEQTYGPFTHPSLTVYVQSGGGGMEHCGATITSIWALGHELTHSWFARGVMPANGNAGWIDEAVASWRDNNYPKASSAPNRPAVNLGGFSPYRRTTTYAAYDEGAELISEFDYLFGNMKTILSTLFENYQRKVITTPLFKSFLEDQTGQNLDAIFRRYVFGKSDESFGLSLSPPQLRINGLRSRHPRALTQAEKIALR